jgi:hypothetical protein
MLHPIVEYYNGPGGVKIELERVLGSVIHPTSAHYVDGSIIDIELQPLPIEQYPAIDTRLPNYYRDNAYNRQNQSYTFKAWLPTSPKRMWWFEINTFSRVTKINTIHGSILTQATKEVIRSFYPDMRFEDIIFEPSSNFTYLLPLKHKFIDNEIGPDEAPRTKALFYLEYVLGFKNYGKNFPLILKSLDSWIAVWPEKKHYQEALKSPTHYKLTPSEMKILRSGILFLTPFHANSKPKLPLLTDPTKAPSTRDWVKLLKYYSNNYDAPFYNTLSSTHNHFRWLKTKDHSPSSELLKPISITVDMRIAKTVNVKIEDIKRLGKEYVNPALSEWGSRLLNLLLDSGSARRESFNPPHINVYTNSIPTGWPVVAAQAAGPQAWNDVAGGDITRYRINSNEQNRRALQSMQQMAENNRRATLESLAQS